jgi:hypothetical protein
LKKAGTASSPQKALMDADGHSLLFGETRRNRLPAKAGKLLLFGV